MISNDIKKEIRFAFSNGASVHEVVATYGIGKTLAYELRNQSKVVTNNDESVVGVLACTHFPFDRVGYLEWVLDVFKEHSVTEVVHLGDMVDLHKWSRHVTEPDAMSGMSEFDRAYEGVQKFKRMFGRWPITWCLGNHDMVPERQLKTLGLPPYLLKSYEELWGVEDWDVCTSKVIDDVMYVHGIGTKATLLTATRLRRSFVSGHFHSTADIALHASEFDRVFGMHVGCGFDDKAYAARYAKESLSKSVIACGTVRDGKHPQLHFMDLQ